MQTKAIILTNTKTENDKNYTQAYAEIIETIFSFSFFRSLLFAFFVRVETVKPFLYITYNIEI